MPDTLPPASEPEPASSSSPKRPWTILGRLSKAVREQNWFAVVLELAIVVLGVVIGFQVTAWGQDRTDRANEQTYLRQLAEDLRQTQRHLDSIDAELALPDLATTRLVGAFYTSTPIPTDSLKVWLWMSSEYRMAEPVVGTADALVATGDLNLIRSDTLRRAITTYRSSVQTFGKSQSEQRDLWRSRAFELAQAVDMVEVFVHHGPSDQVTQALHVITGGSPEQMEYPDPFDPVAFRSDPVARLALSQMANEKQNLSGTRTYLRSATDSLLALVASELTPN